MTTTPDVGVPDELTLAGDFEAPSNERWAQEVAKVLNKGRPEDKQLTPEQAVARLRTSTVDGIVSEPIYTIDDKLEELGAPGSDNFTRGATPRTGEMDGWDVRALHEDPDAKATNDEILADLERGATSIWLRVDPDAIAAADLEKVLAGVEFDLAKVEVSSRTDQKAAADALLAVIEKSGKAADSVSVNLGLDPIGFAALQGSAADVAGLADYAKKVAGYKQSRAIVADGTIWHNAGAGDVHEVAWLLATGAEYVRALIEAGLSPDEAFDAIDFRVTATTNQILTIARLRALRLAWARMGEVFGVSEEKRGARQHAVTSWRQITRDDAYLNILRGTISTFSAVVGGAEAVTVLPFDTAWGLPSSFSRRVARNTQVVLAEESNIARVNDPAGGSWAIESLTRQIAEKAWEQLQVVEAAGGMAAYLAAGNVQKDLDVVKEARAKEIASRKQPITGVSEFPKPDEEPVKNVKERPAAPERGGLVWTRDAVPFEDLRDATKGGDAAVFLACIGTRRDFGGREGFASNYFHIAGLATPEAEGSEAAELAEAFKASGAKVACLCSSAKVYAAKGLEVAKALKEAGAAKVILAGNIKELGDVDTAGVIDDTIAMGSDVVAGLNAVLDTLEVRK